MEKVDLVDIAIVVVLKTRAVKALRFTVMME
jgi:hypothetical protein